MLRAHLLNVFKSWQAAYLSATANVYVAYSGGVDSHVLLHALAAIKDELPFSLSAIHVNHKLHKDSDSWARHCQNVCTGLSTELHQFNVAAADYRGYSPEEWARQRRYAECQSLLKSNDILLTAHHSDDQIETFFLQLFRGAGVLGLAAMPEIKRFGKGWHGRPLLAIRGKSLNEYAEQNKLTWIDDNSNEDTRYDRNYIRHGLLPGIKRRWHEFEQPIGRYIAIAAETQQLIDEIAAEDLVLASYDNRQALLDCRRIKTLSEPRQKNLIRYWLRKQALSLPAAKNLREIFASLVHAKAESAGTVSWQGAHVYRYRSVLCARAEGFAASTREKISWNMTEPLLFNDDQLTAESSIGQGLQKSATENAELTVRFHQGGEKLKLPGRGHHSKLKKLFQEQGIPPWLRQTIPLIFIDDELAMVAGLWTAAKFLADADDASWNIVWRGFNKLIFIQS